MVQKGHYESLVDFLNRLRVDHVLLEFAPGLRRAGVPAPAGARIGVGLGVVDIRTCRWRRRRRSPAGWSAGRPGPGAGDLRQPGLRMWMLPRSVAEAKLRALARGRDLFLGHGPRAARARAGSLALGGAGEEGRDVRRGAAGGAGPRPQTPGVANPYAGPAGAWRHNLRTYLARARRRWPSSARRRATAGAPSPGFPSPPARCFPRTPEAGGCSRARDSSPTKDWGAPGRRPATLVWRHLRRGAGALPVRLCCGTPSPSIHTPSARKARGAEGGEPGPDAGRGGGGGALPAPRA